MSQDQTNNRLDFNLFLRQLKSKKADPILRYIRSFMNGFIQKNWTVDEQIKLINDFKVFIFNKMIEFEPFSLMNSSELEHSKYGIEKLIMTKLYDHVYSPSIPFKYIDESHKLDIELDDNLFKIYKKYELNPNELDVDMKLIENGDDFIKLAAIELNKISNYKTPRAKTTCLLNACKILFQLIKKLDQNQNADEFLPLLIYTILKGQINNLYSNLNYITRFSFIQSSESQYYLVSLNASLEFISKL